MAEDEDIEAVPLGGDRYRLAQQWFGRFSRLRLHWGDEFIAEHAGGNLLELCSVVMPRGFRHYRFVTSSGSADNNPIATIVHQLDGGWETVTGGMLTLTVQMLRVAEFHQRMKAADVFPGVMRPEDRPSTMRAAERQVDGYGAGQGGQTSNGEAQVANGPATETRRLPTALPSKLGRPIPAALWRGSCQAP